MGVTSFLRKLFYAFKDTTFLSGGQSWTEEKQRSFADGDFSSTKTRPEAAGDAGGKTKCRT